LKLYNGYSWYDSEQQKHRDDRWPFDVGHQQRAHRSRTFRSTMVRDAILKVPKGWRIEWRASRSHRFGIYPDKKMISVPFPKTYRGLGVLRLAVEEARRQSGITGEQSRWKRFTLRKGGGHRWTPFNSSFGTHGWGLSRDVKDGVKGYRVVTFSYSEKPYHQAFFKRLEKDLLISRLRLAKNIKVWPENEGYCRGILRDRAILMERYGVPKERYPLPALQLRKLDAEVRDELARTNT
jgi:hypothetical protein